MDMKVFIETWGYWAVLLGSMVEGESVILTASALAAAGYLSIYKVAGIAFMGTLVADQGLYIMGFWYGQKSLDWILGHFPKMRPHVERAFSLLARYQTLYILSFRFIYGVRTISPILIGLQGVPFRTFSLLNLIAALLWTILSCSAGYFFGEIMLSLVQTFGYLLLSVLLGCIGIAGGIVWWRRQTLFQFWTKSKSLRIKRSNRNDEGDVK